MKVLFAYESGSNCNYIGRILDLQSNISKNFSYNWVRPSQYINMNQDGFDVLIYQTFPDENHPFKFNAGMIKELDEKFMEFKGIKILMDSFDNGDMDGFSRFGEASKTLPRIKAIPSWSFLKEFNVVFSVPPYLGMDTIENMEDGERHILMHYAPTLNVGTYSHDIRRKILNVLYEKFTGKCDFRRIPRSKYISFLKHTLISITGPGFGPCSNTFWTAMQYGTLSVAEESVDRYMLLPGGLVPGEHYVSFSLDTLEDKLNYLIRNLDVCNRIRKAGHQRIKEGYNIEDRARDFRQVLDSL